MFRAAGQDRRRDYILQSCRAQGELHEQLEEMGLTISRSGTYLRLLPRNSTTSEGQRHITSVPARLTMSRTQNSKHRDHIDQSFCTASIRSVETIASILGPDQVVFLSQDDW